MNTRVAISSTGAFDQVYKLAENETLYIDDQGTEVSFRFTDIAPGKKYDAPCEELCADSLPTVDGYLEVDGVRYKAISHFISPDLENGPMDMSAFENEDLPYSHLPYEIYVINTDHDTFAEVKIVKHQYIEVERGREFTLNAKGTAKLKNSESYVTINFGICGFDTDCVRDESVTLNGERMFSLGGLGYDPGETTKDNQYKVKPGKVIQSGSVSLKVVDGDNKTFTTFIFE